METALCVKRAPKRYSSKDEVFSYKGWRFYKTRVKGRINSENIVKACKALGMLTPCDHPGELQAHSLNSRRSRPHCCRQPTLMVCAPRS